MQPHTLAPSVEGEVALADLWHRLASGETYATHSGYESGHCFIDINRKPTIRGSGPPALNLLKRVFVGEAQKALAYELHISVPYLHSKITYELCTMMEHGSVSRAPLLLVMAAHAALGLPLGPATGGPSPVGDGVRLSATMPGGYLSDRLPHGELEVARLLLEGKSHSEIAKARQTSQRTVANQLASVFHKLRVSGRTELRTQAVRELSKSYLRPARPPSSQARPLLQVL